MRKITQDAGELLQSLSKLDSDWKDDFAVSVIDLLEQLPEDQEIEENQLVRLLESDFEAASTLFRLFLEMSKDEYTVGLHSLFNERSMTGKKGFFKDKETYAVKLDHMLIREKIKNTINRDYTWKDIIVERLKAGRGSAIKGQRRGRDLEDYVEHLVRSIFATYDVRCRFRGLKGITTEKADFAIPGKDNPEIIIEVKGYGATGSKQTDIIGDIHRIIQEKRHDTVFLLFTDGVTWRSRASDFGKLVEFQNQGFIYRIYTKQMTADFTADLQSLKRELSIGK